MANHIEVSANPSRIRFVADGIINVFQTPFPIFREDGVLIYFNNQEVLKNKYDVTLDAEKRAIINFNDIPENGTIITIVINLPVERTIFFQDGGALRASVLNHEFDYQIACLQQIADNVNRSMVLPAYATDTNVDLTLPTPSAGKAIIWNADGTNIENSTIEINELENTILGYKENAQDRKSVV